MIKVTLSNQASKIMIMLLYNRWNSSVIKSTGIPDVSHKNDSLNQRCKIDTLSFMPPLIN